MWSNFCRYTNFDCSFNYGVPRGPRTTEFESMDCQITEDTQHENILHLVGKCVRTRLSSKWLWSIRFDLYYMNIKLKSEYRMCALHRLRHTGPYTTPSKTIPYQSKPYHAQTNHWPSTAFDIQKFPVLYQSSFTFVCCAIST